jgi:hypothetical protein
MSNLSTFNSLSKWADAGSGCSIIDDANRQSLALKADTSLSTLRVLRVL